MNKQRSMNRLTLLGAIIASALVSQAAFAAGGVTGISVTPTKGLSATNFQVSIQGTGQCDIIIATGKDGADGWVMTQTENLPVGSFPRTWQYDPPALLGSKAVKGNLPAGKYFVEARNTGVNGCMLGQKATTSFEVALPVNLAAPPKCPDGWMLQNSIPGGAYTCKPKPPAASPCPPKHEWFADACSAGCRALAY